MKTAALAGSYWMLVLVAQAQPELSKYRFEQPKMGTSFTLVFYDRSSEHAQMAAEAAFDRIDELNQIFSDYESSSEVSLLSKTAGSDQRIHVSHDLWEVLWASRLISRKSKGAFDVTIGPLSKLWRRAFRQKQFPETFQLQSAQNLVNYKWIKMYKKTHQVKLKKAHMRLDLGGIAKGYTVDQVYSTLLSNGIKSMVVDGGGDLMIGAAPPDGSVWEITNLSRKPIPILEQAIASSGATFKFLNWQGTTYSHIIDPRTGLGVENPTITQVVAANCLWADALASTVSINGSKASRKLLKKFKAYELSETLFTP